MSIRPGSIKIKKVEKIKPVSDSSPTGSIKIVRILTLDSVIREISTDALNDTRESIKNTSKKIVEFNPRSGEVVRDSIIRIFHRHYKYFLVSTQDNAQGKTEYEIKDLASSSATTITISYDIRCELGKEDTLVKKLYSDNSVTDTLNLLIKRFVQVFVTDLKKDSINAADEFYSYKDRLTDDLKRYLSNQIGLQADVALTIKEDDFLRDITISPEIFKIRLMDYNEALSLEMDAGLDVDHANRSAARAYISRQEHLKTFIIDQIKKYLLENITLHQYVYKFIATVKSEVMEMLERALKPKGWRVAWLQLKSKIDFEIPPQNLDMDFSVRCNIGDDSPKIDVEHKLILQLKNVGHFKTNCASATLEEWVKEKLTSITKQEMLNQRYIDILLDFAEEDPRKQKTLSRIQDRMRTLANSIGYSVEQLIVQPDMKPLDILRNGFMLNIEEQSFSTFIKRVDVKLDIVVTGKLKDLRKLHRYISPEKDIVVEMERLVLKETEKQMHDLDPSEFYMPPKRSDEKSAIERLMITIESALEKEFFAHEVKVIIKVVETDLIKRIMALVNGSPYHINVGIMPLAGGGAQEHINFEIEFLIRSISDWNTFIFKSFDPNTGEEIDKIKKALEKDIKSRFMTVPYQVLKYPDIEGAEIVKKVARISHSKIAHIFGLDIYVSNITRSRTMTEIARQKVLATKVAQQITKEKAIIKKEAETQRQIYDKMQDFIREHTTPLDEELGENKELEYARRKAGEIEEQNLYTGVEEASMEQLAPPGEITSWSPEDYHDEYPEEKKKKIPSKTGS